MSVAIANERRIDSLARPKPVPIGFIDDCRSVYWNNKLSKDWDKKDLATKFALTDRQEQLVRPKEVHKEWEGDRPSPIWLVSRSALRAQTSPQIESLAAPKKYHPDFKPRKSVYSTVSSAAKSATPSTRIETLAKAKEYAELPIKPDSCWDYSEWKSDLSAAALKYEANSRITSLSNPKDLHKDYNESRPVIWNVAVGAKKALPTMRVQQLARPKSRSQYKEDYDSNWYKVSPGAKGARTTPRLEELAMPIPRKIRQKRQGAVKM